MTNMRRRAAEQVWLSRRRLRVREVRLVVVVRRHPAVERSLKGRLVR